MSRANDFLEARGLSKTFRLSSGLLRSREVVLAVDNVTFSLVEGETLGIVGESGCGKSTTARLLMQLVTQDSGDILYCGQSVGRELPLRQFRQIMQMVFQDSFASLNPRLTITDTITFGPCSHGISLSEARKVSHDLLEKVGLSPAQFANRYPHEMSGGQRQRVNIARALAMKPRVLILDESVSALDKSVEAQVLNLLADIKEDFHLTYIFISHDLNVIRYACDRVLVMYLGQIVEEGPSEKMFAHPLHPYTVGLLRSMPSGDPARRMSAPPLAGDPPNPINPPSGCRFHPRCEYREPVCVSTEPIACEGSTVQHYAKCHMFNAASGHSRALSV